VTGLPAIPGRSSYGGLRTTVATLTAYAELLDALDAAGWSPCHAEPDRWHWGEDDPDTAEALALCELCPVLDACRSYALAAREPFGTWGGTTAGQRARLLQGQQPERAEPSPDDGARERRNAATRAWRGRCRQRAASEAAARDAEAVELADVGGVGS
jgi:hypothetical protein